MLWKVKVRSEDSRKSSNITYVGSGGKKRKMKAVKKKHRADERQVRRQQWKHADARRSDVSQHERDESPKKVATVRRSPSSRERERDGEISSKETPGHQKQNVTAKKETQELHKKNNTQGQDALSRK